MLLNNLSSFTRTRDRATEFGDYILEAEIPVQKIFFHSELLPGVLKGEDECLVIGGVYEVEIPATEWAPVVGVGKRCGRGNP